MTENIVFNNQIRPEVSAVLRDLGLAAGKLATPEAVLATDKVLSKLGDHSKTLSWFKKINPSLGVAPAEMIRCGRAPQLASYVGATIQ
jgi:hypothetical protein